MEKSETCSVDHVRDTQKFSYARNADRSEKFYFPAPAATIDCLTVASFPFLRERTDAATFENSLFDKSNNFRNLTNRVFFYNSSRPIFDPDVGAQIKHFITSPQVLRLPSKAIKSRYIDLSKFTSACCMEYGISKIISWNFLKDKSLVGNKVECLT